MRKLIVIISIIIVILCISKKNYYEEETIRFRIIANSNNVEDQQLKKEIINNISKDLINEKVKNIQQERDYIISKIPTFEKKIKSKTNNFTINYGYNHFPKKTSNGKTYKEGDYESLVITLGEGNGKNFWCILFPPICRIDEEDSEKIEYKSLIKEVINKIL